MKTCLDFQTCQSVTFTLGFSPLIPTNHERNSTTGPPEQRSQAITDEIDYFSIIAKFKSVGGYMKKMVFLVSAFSFEFVELSWVGK